MGGAAAAAAVLVTPIMASFDWALRASSSTDGVPGATDEVSVATVPAASVFGVAEGAAAAAVAAAATAASVSGEWWTPSCRWLGS